MVLAPLGMYFIQQFAHRLALSCRWLLALPRALGDNLRRQWQGERCRRPHRADEHDPPEFPPPFY